MCNVISVLDQFWYMNEEILLNFVIYTRLIKMDLKNIYDEWEKYGSLPILPETDVI